MTTTVVLVASINSFTPEATSLRDDTSFVDDERLAIFALGTVRWTTLAVRALNFSNMAATTIQFPSRGPSARLHWYTSLVHDWIRCILVARRVSCLWLLNLIGSFRKCFNNRFLLCIFSLKLLNLPLKLVDFGIRIQLILKVLAARSEFFYLCSHACQLLLIFDEVEILRFELVQRIDHKFTNKL
jgi:hypothetical protein